MTDETKAFTSQITDPNAVAAEHEAHRAKAIEHFGGHVHVVRSNQSTVPLHDDQGNPAGQTIIVTTVWKKAPTDDVTQPASTQPQG
jgi:hypothetical protein